MKARSALFWFSRGLSSRCLTNSAQSYSSSSQTGRVIPPVYNSIEAVPGERKRMNLFTAVNDAMYHALQNDPKALVFGEDVAFGGVFR